jgi:predicted Ser/Thr protein kinase
MIGCLTERELWSGIDRNAPEIVEHIEECPSCRARAEGFRATIAVVAGACAPADPPLPTQIGPYRIIRRLGEGGMGIVYEAEQNSPRRLVALKVVRGGATADGYRVKLFQREAQTLARLKHPNIAAIYDAGATPDGQHFFAMEDVQGVPLNAYARSNNLSVARKLELFRRVCEAIRYAHQRGVIHRDLKPSNILMEADGNPKILDFGLARITDPELPRTSMTDIGRIMGTLPYMSPEDARGDQEGMDVRSDVYSLGVILFELLTGELPYRVRRANLPEAVRIICEDPPQRPSAIDRTLRGDLETIVLKALEKTLPRRYQTVEQLEEDVRRFQSNQPILARRPRITYRLRKFVSRHRVYVVVGTAALAVALAARLRVEEIMQGEQERIWMQIDFQDLEKAILENKLGEKCLQIGELDEAEPHFRNALVTFDRLGRRLQAAQSMTRLAGLLIDRNRSVVGIVSDNEFTEAREFLWAALELYEASVRSHNDYRDERRAVLRLLRELYGPDLWDDPDLAGDVDKELQRLDSPPLPPVG